MNLYPNNLNYISFLILNRLYFLLVVIFFHMWGILKRILLYQYCPVSVPGLVIPTRQYSQSIPVIVGTNVVRLCRKLILLRTLPYQMLGNLSHINSIPVKTANNYPITVQPNQVLIIHGLARKTCFTTAVAVCQLYDFQ